MTSGTQWDLMCGVSLGQLEMQLAKLLIIQLRGEGKVVQLVISCLHSRWS